MRLAALRRTLVERRATSATASLARLPEGASGADLARPISHGAITERLKLSASRSAFAAHNNGNGLDFSRSESCHPLTPLPRCWTRKRIPSGAVTQDNDAHAELVAAHRLVAKLVLKQVRPGKRSPAAEAELQSHSDHYLKAGPPTVAMPDIESPLALGSAKHVTIAEAASSHPPTALNRNAVQRTGESAPPQPRRPGEALNDDNKDLKYTVRTHCFCLRKTIYPVTGSRES